VEAAQGLEVSFRGGRIFLKEQDVTDRLREEVVGNRASEISGNQRVREALLTRQRGFRQPPGLVADGRDMGTVVFPDAALKIYLTAEMQVRVQRRYKQL